MAQVFISLIEKCKVDETSSKEDLIDHAIDYATFWTYILGAKGRQKSKLEGHLKYKIMRTTYENIYTNLQNDTYHYSFLQRLKGKSEKKLLCVFEFVVGISKPDIQKSLDKTLDFVNIACKQLEVITTVCNEVSSNLSPAYEAVLKEGAQNLQKIKDELKDGKSTICDFGNLEIFENREMECNRNLLQSCEDMKKFLHVRLFWKSINDFFYDEMNKVLALKKRKNANFTSEKKLQLILGLLSTKCISNFKKHMKRIMDDDIPLSHLFHFFRQEQVTVITLSEELSQIAKLIGCTKFPDERKDAIIRCLDLNFNSKKIAALRKFQANINSTIEEKCDRQMKRFEKIQNNYSESEWSIVNTNSLILDLESFVINFNAEVMGVIIEYSNSKHLISFLRGIMEEDIRNLMDAVEEEYFDQYLPLVSHLVEVKEFLHPILHLPDGTTTDVYISQIKKGLQKTEIQEAAVKISKCSKELDSLKSFYKIFSNKTEKTKDRIENILKNGKFSFKLHETECTVKVDQTSYTISDLIDLRSRALLIKSRFENKKLTASLSNMKENLNLFLKTVRVTTDILDTYKQLKVLGYPWFEKVDRDVELKGLEGKKAYLYQVCEEWENDLDNYRQKYSCLKYIKSEQLQLLFNYTKNFGEVVNEENKPIKEADIESIMWYLHQDLKFLLTKDYKPCDSVPRHYLDTVVNCLEDDFKKLELKGKSFPPFIKADCSDVKLSKNLNFICVGTESGTGLNLILGWFLMKCNKLPLPSQVVLCSDNTSWDELYLLLLRSRKRNNVPDECFCIAFLELLPDEYQRMLINEIEKNDWDNSSLGLIYRGRETDSISTLFRECKIYVQPIHRTLLEKLLQTIFPHVELFTSNFPGLGKTERIRDFAASIEKGIKSLHISGPNKKAQLIERLKQLDLKPYEILHIEIGLADRPEELDIFLFELIMLRYVSFSSMSYVLPETVIALEMANCSNQMMVENMSFSMCFSRNHIEWKNYNNFKCQQVQNSPVQVACAYLGKLDNGDLNTDIDLSSISLINDEKCQSLLKKYFPSFKGINFTIVDAFVSVLGNQLRKFSASSYFQIKNLMLMIGEEDAIAVRKIVIESLIQFSKECALRSITSSRDLQHRTSEIIHTSSSDLKTAVMDLALRTKNMIRWENSNHLVVVFHSQDTQTVSAVYRNLKDVPSNIKEMFKSQIKDCLPDYASIESNKLLEVIVKLTRTKQLSKDQMSSLATGYAYTSDNMLKMLMIALRIQSNIPVIVMGETGCGKTSLIRRLAEICDVEFNVLSVHAGIIENDIEKTVLNANNKAINNRGKHCWLFFDEINTSEYVGFISNIICHRELNGNALSPNLSFIAACNPYRVRESNRFTTGLQGKQSEDALSLLAYRVHPLPEILLDFVWDYGTLSIQEEEAYIERMIQSNCFYPHENLLKHLLGESQIFVRQKEGSSCIVSLRDVNRCIKLVKWFKEKFIPQRQKQMDTTELLLKSFIMGLTICYMCRFSNSDDRLEYRRKISTVFESKSFTTYDEKEIARCVKEEQDAIIERMDIPKGIAKNTTLQENIFVLLVCILNKIPLFIVGKPGCSKSLSMQLIRNNMRGKDSRDKFFQKYPKLFYSSFQGSESSTSDGIIKVFERAKKIKKQGNDVLSLVILDEIGLAEISRFNPLKVLHSLLEPETKENDELEVAVVGISNWSLDSAKMNRAIHLSRPDMNEQELLVTGQYIMESVYDQRSLDLLLSDIAKSYLEYINHQPLTNFHGLRDYYSFVKYVSREFAKKPHPHNENDTTKEKKMLLLKGVLRNFGRNKKTDDAIRRTFLKRLLLDELSICDTKELIIENIIDSEARHLMLMLDGDSALGSIENVIKKHGKDFTIILGSKFPDDEHEEYNYRVLNRIILCMEQPQVLILKDLDDIYGSLYDMLNQNYTIVQGQKHCRVALGPFSNPSCEVHDDFKCIVIIDETNVEKTDPPFLNRFEKQQYLLNDILKPFNEGLAKHLKNFVHDLSSYSKPNTMFNAEDSFPIAGEEIFTSLVTFVEEKLSSYGNSTSETQVFYFCVLELLWILKPDCILRANISKAIAKVRNSIEYLIAMYMDLPIHNGLGYYLQQISAVEKHTFSFYEDEKNKQVPFELKELKDKYLGKKEDDECEIGFSRKKIQYQLRRSDGYGAKLVVFTFTTIYCKIQDTLADINSSLYKLSEFKSEKSFTRVVEEYFKCNKKKWLVIHCDIELDYRRILLAKSIVENSRKSLMRDGETKNVCIVIHIMRSTNPVHVFNKINFSTGWTLATLDSIEKPIISLPYIYNKPVLDVFSANEQEFKETIFRELPWAYAKIQYQGISDNMTDVLQLKNSEFAVQFVSEQIQDWISRHNKKDNIGWQQKAACDKHLLETSATINRTLQNYLSSLIQQPLARILYSVENAGLMNCLLFFETLKPELQDVFRKGCKHQEFYNIDAVSTPSGPGCYVINLKIEKMRVPFSKLIFEKLENYKAEVLRDVRRNNIIPGHFKIVDDDKLMESMLSIVRAHSDVIKKDTELLNGIAFTEVVDDLTIDFCQFATSSIKCRLTRKEKTGLMKWIINLLKGNSDVNNFSTFLLTLNLWTWTYFSNIIGVFDLMDFLKTRQKSYDLSNLLNISKNKKKMFKSIEDVVDSTCVKILSQCIKLKDSDVISWQEGVSKFLTIISKICVTSDKTETLKFFNEFVSVVFTSTTCEFSHLNNFAIHVSKCNWDFKKLEVFETFWKHLESLKKSVEILKLQKIACSFIARCNGTNMKDLVEKEKVNLKAFNLIENGEMFDKSLRFYGHCLRLCLIDYASENEFYKTNKFLQMLENDTSNEDRDKVLCAIHQILCKEDTASFSALFVMALEEEVFCDVIGEVQLNNITEQNDALLKRLILAQNVVISQCIGIRYNVAVAYLKKFLSVTVTLMLNASYKNKCVLSAIDQLLCKEQKDVTQYFFECLKRSSGELGVFKLSITLSLPMQFLKTSTVCPSSESIGWSLMSLNLVRYCSLPDLLLLTSLCDIKKETALLKRLIEGEIASVASLLCFLHCRLFYVESFSKTADSDRLFLKSLQNAGVCHKNDSVEKLVNHLINQHECKIEILRHSTEKSAESNSLTTFLIHFVNLILINEKRECTLYKAVLHCEVSESKPNKIRSSTKYQIRTCTCNHRIVSSDLSCPWCSSNKISGQFVTVCQPIKKKLISTIVRHILIDAALLTSCLFKDVVSKVVLKEVESREKNIKIRWQELREYLQVDDSEQCQLLMIFLEKVKGIFSDTAFSYSEWDPKYDKELRQLLKNRYHELREDNIRHNEMCRKLGKKVAVKNNENGENTKKNLLFCLTEKPSIHNLYLELHMSKAEDKFPCLNLILENFKMLHFPQFIEGILQWHTLLKTKCSNRLRKVECKNITVDTFINQQNEEIQEDLRKTFKIFTDTWGKIITCIPMLEDHTTTLPSVKELTGSSTMDLCILKDINSTVFQVLNALCSWQNKLLDKVLATCVLFNSKALGFLELGSNKAAFPVVALMDLQPRHIIKSMFRADSKRLELFSQIECTAETRNTNYDFRKLEIEWAFKVFYEKAYILIDETMMFMEFKDDLYGHCVQLLHKVSALIPQTTIESELEAKIKEKLKYDSSQGPQLLTLIGTMTTVIVRRKTTEMCLHLAVFAEQLEKLKLIGLSNSCLLPFREYDLTLNKVVAFYTLLEEINGEKYFKALDIEFRDDIHDSTKQQIIHEISGQITLLRACESAMYVFLHRHLYIRDNDINLQQPIADYLRCTELWKNAKISEQQIILPNFEILLQDVFPQDLLVKHVYNFIKLLKDQVSVSNFSSNIKLKLHQNETCILKLYQESRNTTRKRSIEGEFC